MEIRFIQNNLDITARAVKAKMKQSQERRDLGWICKKIKENGFKINGGFLSLIDFASPSQIRVLIENLQYLDLLDEQKNLTESGIQAAENSIVFIPQEGVFLKWEVENNFLFSCNRLIHWMLYEAPEHSLDSIKKEKYPNGVIQSQIDAKHRSKEWLVKVIGNRYKRYDGKISSFKWSWKVDMESKVVQDTSIQIKGQIQVPSRDRYSNLKTEEIFNTTIPSPVKLNYEDMKLFLNEVFAEEGYSWNNELNSLGVFFDDCSSKDKDLFSMEHMKEHYEYLNQVFNIEIKDIPIVPINLADASKWLKWLFEKQFNGHLTHTDQKILIDDIKNNTPLGDFNCRLDLYEFKNKLQNSLDKRYWLMVAGDDLSLQPKIINTRRISSGEVLTYDDAFKRLFPEIDFSRVNRIVYMDRHILEKHNIGKTERLIGAFKDNGFNGKFFFVTKGKNIELLREDLTNITIRDYSEVYEKGANPHGRYLVFETTVDTFFYDLTHNLYHPRERYGGLQWNDISTQSFSKNEIKDDPTRGILLEVR